MKKVFSIAAILFVFSCICVFKTEAMELKRLEFSYYKNEPVIVYIRNNELIIENAFFNNKDEIDSVYIGILTKDGSYEYRQYNRLLYNKTPDDDYDGNYMLKTYDYTDMDYADINQDLIPITSLSQTITCDLNRIPSGTYDLYINRLGSFTNDSVFWESGGNQGAYISLIVSNNKSYFNLGEVYEKNVSFINKRRTDKDAINYFLYPENYKKNVYAEIYVSDSNEDRELVEKVNSIISDCKDDLSKALAIHDWIAKNIYYDNDLFYGDLTYYNDDFPYSVFSAMGTYKRRKGVCENFSVLTCAMMRIAGIPCIEIGGLAKNSKGDWEPHAWNEIFVDGKWIIVDTTWDTAGGTCYKGTFSKGGGNVSYKYFNPSLETFSYTHKIGGDSQYQYVPEDGFVIKDKTVLQYLGNDVSVIIPNGITGVNYNGLIGTPNVTIPKSVKNLEMSGLDKTTSIFGESNTAASKFAQKYDINFIDLKKETCKVSFNTNGGSLITPVTLNKGNTLKKEYFTAPVKDGYELSGWYTDKEFKHYYNFSGKIQDNIMLYAKWEVSFPKLVYIEAFSPTVKTGGNLKLSARVYPDSSNEKELTWSVSDKSIATINKNGLVKALKQGKVTVTCKVKNSNIKSQYEIIIT